MLGFVLRRLGSSLLVLLLSSVIVFTLVVHSGNPLGSLLSRQPPPPEAVIELRRRELNLDKPVVERYVIWLTNFARGEMGETVDGRDVRELLGQRIQVTLRMVIGAMLLALVLAVLVGVYSAVKQYSVGDYAATFSGFLFLAMPSFWLAVLLKEFLAIRLNNLVGRTIVYTVGDQTPNLQGSFGDRLADYLGHLVLPTIALALISYAAWSRFQRSAMLDVLNSDYIRLARAKGVSSRRVLVRHALRNALIPLTTVVAIDFGAILGGAVITEEVFAWQGMGQMFLEGVRTYDVNVVLAWLMVAATMVVLLNLIADLVYGVLDPRIRYG